MALRCFIAMAFGKIDTDAVYDNVIVPLLTEESIKPIRIDRLEFNDDIDKRIIAELHNCDCVIADLTYARPSVYFEAGFAQRQVPVIYTCRNDHFTQRHNDKYGNFKVHFDLQMKNIIPWKNKSDKQFSKKLHRRIKLAFGPLLKAKEKDSIKQQEIQKFLAQSLQTKTNQILHTAVKSFEKLDYYENSHETEKSYKATLLSEKVPISVTSNMIEGFPIVLPLGWFGNQYIKIVQFTRILSLLPGWLGVKYYKQGISSVFVYVGSTITKKQLNDLYFSLLGGPLYSIALKENMKSIKELHEIFVLCTLQQIPGSRTMDSLPSFTRDSITQALTWTTEQLVPTNEITDFNEVYALPKRLDEQLFIRNLKGRTYDQLEGRPVTIKGNKIQYHGNKTIGRVKRVPRTISVYLCDGINSQEKCKEYFDSLITNIS